MEQYIIKGGNPLVGEVRDRRSKECSISYFSSGNYDR